MTNHMKTAETRAKELFRMVYPDSVTVFELSSAYGRWLALARYVLSLETKLAKAKKRPSTRRRIGA